MRWIVALAGVGLAQVSGPGTARADTPQVITDIRPVHSITAAVMGDLGTPTLLLEGDEDPHNFALRPSQVRGLAAADLVVWMGEGNTPWLENGLEVAKGAVSLELLELEGLPLVLTPGEEHHDAHDEHGEEDHGDEDHAEHDDAHDDDHGDDHGDEDHAEHDDHDEEHDEDHADEDHAKHDDHDEDHADDHADEDHAGHDDAHDHGDTDPHAWLDPLNGAHFATAIGAALAEIDPGNAATYTANAAATAAQYEALAAEIAAQIGPDYAATVLVYHDAYRYFFERFDVPTAATITNLHGISPSAAQIAELRDSFGDAGAVCLLTEQTADPRVIATALPDAATYEADQLGRSFAPGPQLYEALLRDIAATLVKCQG